MLEKQPQLNPVNPLSEMFSVEHDIFSIVIRK